MFTAKNNFNNIIMKKQILNLGKALNKTEQKDIFGGLTYLTHEGDETCYVKSCLTSSDCAEVGGCKCRRNNADSRYGYCQKK